MGFEEIVDKIRQTLHGLKRKHNLALFEGNGKSHQHETEGEPPPWNWVAEQIVKLLAKYPSGLTEAIAFSELELQWDESMSRFYRGIPKKFNTIETLFSSSISHESVFELSVEAINTLPNTGIVVLSLSSPGSTRHVDMYLHQRYLFLTEEPYRSILFFNSSHFLRFTSTHISTNINGNNSSTISRLLPTDNLAIMVNSISDYDFILSEFGIDKLSDVTPQSVGAGREFRLWVKVLGISSVVTTRLPMGDRQRHIKVHVTGMSTLTETDDELDAFFILYDEQINLERLFGKGDCLGIYRPYISADFLEGEILLEYGTATVLFLMSSSDPMLLAASQVQHGQYNSESGSVDDEPIFSGLNTQIPILRDDQGIMDCRLYAKRIKINEVRPMMSNLALFGRIIAMAENTPVSKEDGLTLNRFPIRLGDETGTIDITLWEEIGYRASNLRPGDYVFFTGLTTSARENSKRPASDKRSWFVNGTFESGCSITCVSRMKGFLTSSFLRDSMYLYDAVGLDRFQCRVVVVGWVVNPKLTNVGLDSVNHVGVLDRDVTTLAHSICNNSLTMSSAGSRDLFCNFCRRSVQQGIETMRIFGLPRNYNYIDESNEDKEGILEWLLDDGTGVIINAMGCIEDILGLSAMEFLSLSHDRRVVALDEVVGLEFWCEITQVSQNQYRVQAAVPAIVSMGVVTQMMNILLKSHT